MGAKNFKPIKCKVRLSRGDSDSRAMIKSILDNWEEIQEQLKTNHSEEEQENIKEYFNQLFEDHTDLGDCIFGSKDEFEDKIATVDDDELKQFTSELLTHKAIDDACSTNEVSTSAAWEALNHDIDLFKPVYEKNRLGVCCWN